MILVTGAGGKTGLAVIAAMTNRALPVRALVYRSEYAQQALQAGATEIIVGDMRDANVLNKAMQGIDHVYHICPNVHPDELLIGKNIIKFAKKNAMSMVVYHSVLHPQAERMPHHWQKMRVEEALFESGIPYVVLQPAPYMQNILARWTMIVNEGIYQVPYGPATRLCMVDLDDVAEVAALVSASEKYHFGVFELTGNTGLTQYEVAEMISEKSYMEIRIERVSIGDWRKQNQSSGMNSYALSTLESMFRYYDSFGLEGNINVLYWLLQRLPTTFSEFLERELDRRRRFDLKDFDSKDFPKEM